MGAGEAGGWAWRLPGGRGTLAGVRLQCLAQIVSGPTQDLCRPAVAVRAPPPDQGSVFAQCASGEDRTEPPGFAGLLRTDRRGQPWWKRLLTSAGEKLMQRQT